MPRRAAIEVVGDARSYLSALKKSEQATRSFAGDLKHLSTEAKTSAEAQVAASLKKQDRLKAEAVAYREVAAAAKHGSTEQVTAANKAAAAEQRLARELGTVVKQEERVASSAGHAGRKLRAAEHDAGKFTRGVLAGSGAVKHLGRSLAFASAGFLTFAGFSELLHGAIGGAAQLGKQVRNVGIVFQASGKEVIEWAHSLPNALGLTTAEALKATTVFGRMLAPLGIGRERAAGMSEALAKLAPDLAAFSDMPLDKTIAALRSGLAGMPRPLRQFGVFLTTDRLAAEALSSGIVKANVDSVKLAAAQGKVTLATVAVAAARKKYGAASSEAYAAELKLHGAEAKLSGVLAGHVPKLNQAQKSLAAYNLILKDTAALQGYAVKTGDTWGGNMRQLHAITGNLEEEIGTVLMPTFLGWLRALTAWLGQGKNQQTIVNAIRGAVHGLGVAFSVAASVVRPLARGAEAVAGELGGWKTTLTLLAGAWVGFKVAGVGAAAAVAAANLVAAGVTASAWRAALVTTGWTAIAVAAGAAAAYIMTHWGTMKLWFRHLWTELEIDAVIAAGVMMEPFSHLPSKLGGWARSALDSIDAKLESLYMRMHAIDQQAAAQAARAAAKPAAPELPGVDLGQGPNEAAAAASKALTAAERKAIADYNKAMAEAQKQAGKFKAGGTDAAEKAKEAAAKAAAARQARQYAFLGLTATGDARLTIKGLQRQLGNLENVTKGTFLDTAAQRSHLDKLRQLLSGKLGALSDDVRAKIQDAIQASRDMFNKWQAQLQQKRDDLRGVMGQLFAGPVLQPTDEQVKRMLGVPGPTVARLTKDLRAQTAQFLELQRNLASLQKRGAPKALITELRGMGQGAASEVASLAGASQGELGAFFAAYRARQGAIGSEARREMKPALVRIRTPRVVLDPGTRVEMHRGQQRAEEGKTTIVVPVYLDGKVVAKSTTTHQQRTRKKSAAQVRGRHPGDTLAVN